jgi:3-deoxy-manno-octulosonate cytidylyltransferase (CMP-KDO synthetase)
MRKITDAKEINNPNNVKVVVDQSNFALYFSRAAIPYPRESNAIADYFQHIGIYAFRKEALIAFSKLPMKMLETTEKLEQLRYLEFGKRIKMVLTDHISFGIDTEEDLIKARMYLDYKKYTLD